MFVSCQGRTRESLSGEVYLDALNNIGIGRCPLNFFRNGPITFLGTNKIDRWVGGLAKFLLYTNGPTLASPCGKVFLKIVLLFAETIIIFIEMLIYFASMGMHDPGDQKRRK